MRNTAREWANRFKRTARSSWCAGGEIDVLEGDWQPKRMVLCVFDSMDKARQWYDSDEYRELKKIRENTARMNMVVVEGI